MVDKALNNNHCIPLMAQLFPRAKFIYCNRDAMDNCVAIYRQNFLGAYPYAYDLKEIGSYYKLNETLINRYREVVPDERFHTIDYEVLVDNPEEEIRKLLAFCELEWQDNCLHFHKADRAVKTASAAQVRKPIYRSSVNSWKRYGDNLQPLQKILGSS